MGAFIGILLSAALMLSGPAFAASGAASATTSNQKLNRKCDADGDGKVTSKELEAVSCEKAIVSVLVSLERKFAIYSEEAFQELLKEVGNDLEKKNQGKPKAELLGACVLGLSDLVLKGGAGGEVGEVVEWVIPDSSKIEKTAVCGGIFQNALPKVATRLKSRAEDLASEIRELESLITELGGEAKLNSALEVMEGLRKRGQGWGLAAKRAAKNGYAGLKLFSSPLGAAFPGLAAVGAVAFVLKAVPKGSKDVQEGTEACCSSVIRAHELSPDSSWRPSLLKRCLKKQNK